MFEPAEKPLQALTGHTPGYELIFIRVFSTLTIIIQSPVLSNFNDVLMDHLDQAKSVSRHKYHKRIPC